MGDGFSRGPLPWMGGSEDYTGSPGVSKDQRIAELEAALKPFADAHRWLEECNMGAMRAQYEASIRCTGKFCEADLKRAAELV